MVANGDAALCAGLRRVACWREWRGGDHILPAGGKTLWEKVVGPLFYSRSGWADVRLLVEPILGWVIAGPRRSDGRVARLRRFASSGASRVGAAICHGWHGRCRRFMFLARYSWSAHRSRNSAGGPNDKPGGRSSRACVVTQPTHKRNLTRRCSEPLPVLTAARPYGSAHSFMKLFLIRASWKALGNVTPGG